MASGEIMARAISVDDFIHLQSSHIKFKAILWKYTLFLACLNKKVQKLSFKKFF
jgi:hypothetical protein